MSDGDTTGGATSQERFTALFTLSVALPAEVEAMEARDHAREIFNDACVNIRKLKRDDPSRGWRHEVQEDAAAELRMREDVVQTYRGQVQDALPLAMASARDLGLSITAFGPVATWLVADPTKVAAVVAACEEAIAHLRLSAEGTGEATSVPSDAEVTSEAELPKLAKAQIDPPLFIDSTAAAARLGKEPRTITRWCNIAKKPCHNAFLQGKTWFIPDADVPMT